MHSNTHKHWLKLCFMALIWLVMLSSASAFAKGDVFVDRKGVAIRGYDPVAYFVSSKPQKGKAEFAHIHAGNTWFFANASNKNAFIANPVAYLPQYGGHCAYAASKNSVAPVDPEAWEILDNKLYLNYSLRIHAKWTPNATNNIVKANSNWPKLVSKVKTR